MIRRAVSTFLFSLLLCSAVSAEEPGGGGFWKRSGAAEEGDGKPWTAGVLLEGSRSEIDLEVSDLDAVDWQGLPINGAATGDPNDNAEYATQRTYTGIKGFFSFTPGGGITLTGFLRMGQVREVFRCSFDEGSFFVDWGDRPETNVTAYVGSVLVGGGISGSLRIQKFVFGIEAAFGWNSSSYKNQDWFDARTDGEISITTIEIRFQGGYDFEFVVPRVGLGVFLYTAVGEFQEILRNNGRNRHFDAIFEGVGQVSLTLGADVPAGERILISVEAALLGELALRLALGIRI